MESSTRDRTVSTDDLVLIVRRNLIFIILFTAAVTAGTALLSFKMQKQYLAVAVVSPVSDSGGSSMGALGNLASQLGRFSSLAGISLPTQGDNSEAVAILQSDTLTMEFIVKQDLMPILFSGNWDAATKSWKPDGEPSLWYAKEVFKQLRTVTVDTKTGLVHVAIRWRDATQAASWANGLVQLTNESMRKHSLAEADSNVAYLKDQVARSTVVEIRNALYSLMQAQITKAMVASGSDSFAFKVIDQALPPERPVSPRPSLWIPTALIGSLFLSLVLSILRAGLLGRRTATA